MRILRTNSSETTFGENISDFKKRLIDRGYPQTSIENLLSDIKFIERESALLKHNNKEEKESLAAFHDTVPALSVYFKRSFYEKMESYKKQPLLRQMFKEPPIISFKKGKSLKDMLVRAKIEKVNTKVSHRYGCAAYHPSHFLMFPFLTSPLFLFFCPRPYFLDELTRERLLRRLDHTNQHCRNKR